MWVGDLVYISCFGGCIGVREVNYGPKSISDNVDLSLVSLFALLLANFCLWC